MADPFPDTQRSTRLKRLKMRAWRRGMKEMDLILGEFVDEHAPSLSDEGLDSLERLMERPDQDLFLWMSGVRDAPADADPGEREVAARIMRQREER